MIKNLAIISICLLILTGVNEETIINTSEKSSYLNDVDKVIVAVIDSKVNVSHEFLKDSCLESKEFVLEESTQQHGTSVAAAVLKYASITANEIGENNHIMILPVEVNVLDIQVDGGYLLASAIEYAIDSGAKVINMSFSSYASNIYVYEKIRYGLEKGVVFIAAAGNSGLDKYSFPAAYEGVISAGSYYQKDNIYYRSQFSNSNNDVDLLLEGKMLLADGASYSEKSGTSFSAGALSGIVAELISRFPEINSQHIIYALFDTAIPLNAKGTGYGAANIKGAIEYLNKLQKDNLSPMAYAGNISDVSKVDTSKAEDFKAELIKSSINNISAGRSHAVYVNNGRIEFIGKDADKYFTSKWDNIVNAYAGNDNTAAINNLGLPMATGYNLFNKNVFKGWGTVNELSLSENFTAALTEKGNVLVTDYLKNLDYKSLTNIKQISTGAHHLSALTNDGKVINIGYNLYGQMDTSDWKDIVFINANTKNTVAIDKGGNVFTVGDNLYGQCNLSDWKDIIQVSIGDGFVVGLKSDGTVSVKGRNLYNVCGTNDLKNIKYIKASNSYFIAIDIENNVYLKGVIK